ncbi:MAG: 3-dehydroquinate synthase II, partial [SAR202 cluster bacterium]|nr:3-dehydroquinate synthase II [SAR202 cluster bacterium]
MSNVKNIVVEYNDKSDTKFEKIVTQLKQSGVNTLLCYDEKIITICKQLGLHSISNLDQADDLLIDNLKDIKKFNNKNKKLFFNILVKSNEDIKKAVEAAKLGVNVVIVETSDWKIIPIENLIAELADFPTQIFTRLENMSEAKTMFNILEKGVDGLIINLKNSINIEKILSEINDDSNISLSNAEIIDIQNVDSGDRVCIDT